MKRQKKLVFIILVVLISVTPTAAFAQEAGLNLKLIRTFGFGGFNGDIQGTFTLKASGPDGLDKVEFYVDDLLIGVVEHPPYEVQFLTDMYNPGEHDLYAIGYLEGGTTLESVSYRRLFVSGVNAWDSIKKTLLPIFGVVILVTVMGIGFSTIGQKNKKFELGRYGPVGGAICKSCNLPFSRSMMSPNLLLGKLEKCPHCGTFQLTISAPKAMLKVAENLYCADQLEGEFNPEESDEERLLREIDDSRYEQS
ncbi:MAG: hypothetical protein JXA19_01360 [Anaerolineales bacterium]|nr:hypothetical protein [Anaerolineales bacterium]